MRIKYLTTKQEEIHWCLLNTTVSGGGVVASVRLSVCLQDKWPNVRRI